MFNQLFARDIFFIAATLLLLHQQFRSQVERIVDIKWTQRLILVAAVAAVAVFLAKLFLYPFAPGYLDHVEPQVVSVSMQVLKGGKIHPDWTAGEGVYGLPYGPALFQISAAFLAIHPSILVSKLLGVLSTIASLVLLWLILDRQFKPRSAALILFLSAIIVSSSSIFLLSTRADPLLLLGATAALFVYTRMRVRGAALVIGAIAGVESALKLHAMLYILPLIIGMLAAQKGFRARLRILGLTSAGCVSTFAISYLLPGASLKGNLENLRMTSHHGLSFHQLLANALFVGSFLVLLVTIWKVRGVSLDPVQLVLLGSTIVCLVLVAIIGAKRGAGLHHLIPCLPLIFLSAGWLLAGDSKTAPGPKTTSSLAYTILLVIFVAYEVIGPSFKTEVFRQIRGASVEHQKIAELVDLYTRYPKAQMGASDSADYDDTQYRVIGAFSGGPLLFDPSTWMDLQFAGVDETPISQLIEGCRVPNWILPARGDPFSMANFYTDKRLFSEQFAMRFESNYSLQYRGRFYSVWSCRSENTSETIQANRAALGMEFNLWLSRL
jgi:hypothetical protein